MSFRSVIRDIEQERFNIKEDMKILMRLVNNIGIGPDSRYGFVSILGTTTSSLQEDETWRQVIDANKNYFDTLNKLVEEQKKKELEVSFSYENITRNIVFSCDILDDFLIGFLKKLTNINWIKRETLYDDRKSINFETPDIVMDWASNSEVLGCLRATNKPTEYPELIDAITLYNIPKGKDYVTYEDLHNGCALMAGVLTAGILWDLIDYVYEQKGLYPNEEYISALYEKYASNWRYTGNPFITNIRALKQKQDVLLSADFSDDRFDFLREIQQKETNRLARRQEQYRCQMNTKQKIKANKDVHSMENQ